MRSDGKCLHFLQRRLQTRTRWPRNRQPWVQISERHRVPAHGLLRYRPVQVSPKGHVSCLSYPNVRLHVLHSFVGNKSELLSCTGTVVSPGTLLSVSSRWGGRAVGLGLIKVRSTRSLQVGSSSNLRHHFLMLTSKQERCSEKQNHVI